VRNVVWSERGRWIKAGKLGQQKEGRVEKGQTKIMKERVSAVKKCRKRRKR
jgi:hypothetical protein